MNPSKELQLIKQEPFGDFTCDIYSDSKDYYMTREQAGRALEYARPADAIQRLHERHPDRLNQFSVTVKLTATDGKAYDTYLYTLKGVMEICRWSQQPKADAFMDFTWGVMEALITGKAKIVPMSEYQRMVMQSRIDNAHVRKARELTKLSEKYTGTSFAQVLDSYATEILTGEKLIPLPRLAAQTYSATDIGNRLGISANMVGILTNRHNLKTDEYGAWFNDKAKGHAKEVQAFRYYESIIPVLEAIIAEQSA